MNFDAAFHKLLGHEGGFVDHAADPGGATRWGVTERVARQHGYKGSMRELPVEVAKEIYHASYWTPIRADELPDVLRYDVFDAAVNSGNGQAVRWLQRALGVADDGIIGPVTLRTANAANSESVKRKMLAARLRFMTDLSTWQHFGRGWARRVADLMGA